MSFKISGYIANSISGRLLGGGAAGIPISSSVKFNRNKLTTFANFVSIPVGTRPPHCFLMATKSGGIASHGNCVGEIENTNLNLAGGLNAESSITTSITVLNITGQLILQALSTILANGNFSTLPVLNGASYAQAVSTAQLLASGDLGAIIDIVMTENISITENISSFAGGSMNAVIGGPNPLSPEGLAEAVWSKNLSSYMTDETAGKLIKEIKEEIKKKLDAGLFIALK